MLQNFIFTKNVFVKASPEAVWDALTKPEKIKLYLFGTEARSTWQKGSPILFAGEWEGKSYQDGGTILEIERERIFQYDYRSSFSSLPDLPENYSIVTFQLDSQRDGIELTLEQRGFENKDAFQHSETGWTTVLETIKQVVENDSVHA